MKKKKILVTGSGGTVGLYVASVFSKDKLFLTTKQNLDITDKKSVFQVFEEIRPDVVIHLAAKTNVDDCEENSREAYLINALGTQNIAEACKKNHVTIVYISSLAVFNGEKEYFTEEDKPKPVNVYGKTKLLGEKAIQKLVKNHIIIRTGWIVGGGMKEKKFISYILQQAKQGKKEIRVVNDKFGTIAYAKELVEFIKLLLDKKKRGIYHFGSLGICSRFTIVQYIVKLLRMDILIIPVSSDFFADRFFAPRPKNEAAKSIKLPISYFRPWKESLKEYLLKELKDE